MKIEKKLVALSILAITIGIATIAPVSVFMNAKAQTNQTYGEPWFNIEIPSAYVAIDLTNDGYMLTEILDFQPSLTDNALNQQSEARIEYFEVTFSTDDMQLAKNIYCIGMGNPDNEDPAKIYAFYMENWVNGSSANIACNGSIYITDLIELTYPRGFGHSYIVGDEFETALDTQTIYLDVRSVCYVTFDGNNTVVTWADDQDIQHITLTNNGNSFVFGDRDNSDMDTFRQTHFGNI
ncbi:hypothetical protein [Candidatus Bathycorpusculum sp.]|uniref:hypothetical protein n=1 Tax=Candidatus Bathycorpusculum sp. TaxID=2994959 RepID=UPI002839DBFB|nr:hypothetical protein [Candidatus Termitimicrobium sp.]MCL2431473.1 hypothetical protein [Candidatus Termitimicrobium sp.]